jgi:hypothetical protein
MARSGGATRQTLARTGWGLLRIGGKNGLGLTKALLMQWLNSGVKMTTIAFDGTTLAADRKMGDRYNVQKIFKVPQGYAAGCGDYDYVIEIVQWLCDGADRNALPQLPDKDRGRPDADVIVITPQGKVNWLSWPFLRFVPLSEKKVAYGSGSDFALGAMAAGATAKQAVAIACKFDSHTGQGIDSVRVLKK